MENIYDYFIDSRREKHIKNSDNNYRYIVISLSTYANLAAELFLLVRITIKERNMLIENFRNMYIADYNNLCFGRVLGSTKQINDCQGRVIKISNEEVFNKYYNIDNSYDFNTIIPKKIDLKLPKLDHIVSDFMKFTPKYESKIVALPFTAKSQSTAIKYFEKLILFNQKKFFGVIPFKIFEKNINNYSYRERNILFWHHNVPFQYEYENDIVNLIILGKLSFFILSLRGFKFSEESLNKIFESEIFYKEDTMALPYSYKKVLNTIFMDQKNITEDMILKIIENENYNEAFTDLIQDDTIKNCINLAKDKMPALALLIQ